jgi:hypothetical protein
LADYKAALKLPVRTFEPESKVIPNSGFPTSFTDDDKAWYELTSQVYLSQDRTGERNDRKELRIVASANAEDRLSDMLSEYRLQNFLRKRGIDPTSLTGADLLAAVSARAYDQAATAADPSKHASRDPLEVFLGVLKHRASGGGGVFAQAPILSPCSTARIDEQAKHAANLVADTYEMVTNAGWYLDKLRDRLKKALSKEDYETLRRSVAKRVLPPRSIMDTLTATVAEVGLEDWGTPEKGKYFVSEFDPSGWVISQRGTHGTEMRIPLRFDLLFSEGDQRDKIYNRYIKSKTADAAERKQLIPNWKTELELRNSDQQAYVAAMQKVAKCEPQIVGQKVRPSRSVEADRPVSGKPDSAAEGGSTIGVIGGKPAAAEGGSTIGATEDKPAAPAKN